VQRVYLDGSRVETSSLQRLEQAVSMSVELLGGVPQQM
jgi:hypothetical protein